MMFTEQNSVECFVIHELTGVDLSAAPGVRETLAAYFTNTATWKYASAPHLPRKTPGILAEPILAEALRRLDLAMRDHPDRTDEVIRKLRGILG